MSKKSRRRNKKLLALAGLAGAVALSSKRKRDASIADNEANESGFAASNKKLNIADVSGPIKDTSKSTRSTTSVVNTPTTVIDSMPPRPKFNQKSKRIVPGTNKVFTIEGVKQGVEPKVGNSKSLFIGDDGSYTQGNRTFPNKMSYMNRDKKPAMLGLKSGGRAGLKSGGKVKGCGIAKRGLGRAMKKGKR